MSIWWYLSIYIASPNEIVGILHVDTCITETGRQCRVQSIMALHTFLFAGYIIIFYLKCALKAPKRSLFGGHFALACYFLSLSLSVCSVTRNQPAGPQAGPYPSQSILSDPMSNLAMAYGSSLASQGKEMVDKNVRLTDCCLVMGTWLLWFSIHLGENWYEN